MGQKFKHWVPRTTEHPKDYQALSKALFENRNFTSVESLEYGDHGLEDAFRILSQGIKDNKRIALYADYDVDGTMSCVSWIWFLESIGFKNYVHYIPDRFKEGYGVNLKAVQHLAQNEKADIIITMDTGITANEEAKWCRDHGVQFVCTDHHKVQAENMPDCVILNPKLHPDPDYQELCGCGVTFVLLRQLGKVFSPPPEVWTDILAITGMATICDVVPLNGVNHKLAQLGVKALWHSNRPVLKKLLTAASVKSSSFDERDIGFRLGPRINAVGRLDHADKIIEAFIGNNADPLIKYMNVCNERRKKIQADIVAEATQMAAMYPDDPVLFLGGENWHQGVVGIAASKIAETFWKPVWLFQKGEDLFKGSARSIPGFDVTETMFATKELFLKCGGHKAAGGFSFAPENEDKLRKALNAVASKVKSEAPKIWESTIHYDCKLPMYLASLDLMDHLAPMRPFGHMFEEPKFRLEAAIDKVVFYNDKETGEPKHTAVFIKDPLGKAQKIMFFNEVCSGLKGQDRGEFLVTASRQQWQGKASLSLIGSDYEY